MLKIYGVPISVHTRKVIVAARLKQLPFEVVPVVPVIPDNPPPDWRSLSPTGKIPVLQDGDFTLADSAAICAYLERKQPQPPLYPADIRATHGHALWLEQYAGGTVFRDVVHPLFHEAFVHPKIKGIATDPARIDAVLTTWCPRCSAISTRAGRALSRRRRVVGGRPGRDVEPGHTSVHRLHARP